MRRNEWSVDKYLLLCASVNAVISRKKKDNINELGTHIAFGRVKYYHDGSVDIGGLKAKEAISCVFEAYDGWQDEHARSRAATFMAVGSFENQNTNSRKVTLLQRYKQTVAEVFAEPMLLCLPAENRSYGNSFIQQGITSDILRFAGNITSNDAP